MLCILQSTRMQVSCHAQLSHAGKGLTINEHVVLAKVLQTGSWWHQHSVMCPHTFLAAVSMQLMAEIA